MDHVAILSKRHKDWLRLILCGEKTLESRWYKSKRAPWNRIHFGDVVYFKNSSEPVTAKAIVDRVLQFDNLTYDSIKNIYKQYGEVIGIEKHDLEQAISNNRNKKYCILIFLENPLKIEPFTIDKNGFGNMSAWLCVENIDKIRH